MNRCPRCGIESAQHVPFCGGCGHTFATLPRQRTWLPLLLLGLVLGVGFYAAKHFASLSKVRADGSPTLRLSESTQPPVLSRPASAQPASISQASQALPEDVRRWLEHLKRVDDMRAEYNRSAAKSLLDKLGEGLMAIGAVETEEEASQDESRRRGYASSMVEDVREFFVGLSAKFNSLPPPAECAAAAARYNEALLGVQSMLSDVFSGIETGSAKLLESLQGKSFERVDAVAKLCNSEVDLICARYKAPNRYKVLVEEPGSVSFQGLLLGGGGLNVAPPVPKIDDGG